MNKSNAKRVLQRAGALLLSSVLCVSAFASSASAEAPGKGKIQTSTQQSQSEQKVKAKPNQAELSKDKSAAKKTDAEGNAPGIKTGKNSNSTVERPKKTAAEAVQSQTVQIQADGSVTFSVPLGTSKRVDAKLDPDAIATELQGKAESPKKDEKKINDAEKSHTAKDTAGKDSEGEGTLVFLPVDLQLKYNWQMDKNDGKGWVDIPDANNADYTLNKVTKEQDGWKYRCVISWAAEHAESGTVVLQIVEPPRRA